MAVSWKLSLLSYRINYVGSMLLGIVLAVWFTVIWSSHILHYIMYFLLERSF